MRVHTIFSSERTELITVDELLLKTRDVAALQRPSNQDYTSVRHFIKCNEPLIAGKMTAMRRKEDLITLRSAQEYPGFDAFVERSLSCLDKLLARTLGWRVVQI